MIFMSIAPQTVFLKLTSILIQIFIWIISYYVVRAEVELVLKVDDDADIDDVMCTIECLSEHGDVGTVESELIVYRIIDSH